MGLFENMKNEQVKALECRKPVLVAPDDSVREVIKAMRAGSLGCAVLVDGNKCPVGVFTESQLTKLVAAPVDHLDEPVSQHVAPKWPQVSVTDSITKVLAGLTAENTRFLVVVDEAGKVTGLTGQKGLMEYVADHFPGQVTVQRIGQKPYMHQREGA